MVPPFLYRNICVRPWEMVFYFDTEYQTVYRAEIRNRPETALHIYRIDPATQEGLANAGYVVYVVTRLPFTVPPPLREMRQREP